MTTKKTAEHRVRDERAASVLRAIAAAEFEGDVGEAAYDLVEALAYAEDDFRAALGERGGLRAEIRELSLPDAARAVADRLDPPAPTLAQALFGRG